MVKRINKASRLKIKNETSDSKNVIITRRHSKRFKKPKHIAEHKTSLSNDNFLDYDNKILDQNDINECINGIKVLDNFIAGVDKEMKVIRLPFHVNLIRKRNTGYTKYTKIYRKRMLKLIGFGNRFGPHYHKDEKGHIYSMEYTDRITSKSLVFFRCQLKGCRAKGVLNANTKKFIVNQNHALQYVSHIPNKKSNIKILIEKAFAEKSYLKDIQIIFCTYLADTKIKKNINMISDNSNVNNNYNIKESENNDYSLNIPLLGDKNIADNSINVINNNIKKELSRGELFQNYYNDKFKSGENKYEEYLNKIILANRDNERKTNQCLYTVEINLNNNNKNKNNLYYLKENQIFGNRYHKNLSNEIYLYSFDNYDKEEKHILFICGYEGCTGQAFYDLETKQFNITVPHLLCYELHYKSFQQIDSYKKVKKIFDEAPEYTDIQFILKDKTINILK
jgi:hypothetical protein